MTEVDFICLPAFEKAQYIWAEGEFIGGRTTAEYQLLLYQLEGFYAEVFYSIAEKRIENIEVLRDESLLGLYVEEVNIDDLFKNL